MSTAISLTIVALAFAAAWFWGLYERNKAKTAETRSEELRKQLIQAQADAAAQQVRYEALVADLKTQLKALEDSYDAFATPESLRARFRELFPHPAGEGESSSGSVSPSAPAAS